MVATAMVFVLAGTSAAYEPDSAEFFEQRIRPVLIKHCYQCHSEKSDEIGGSLWLDSADAMRHGGDSGPAIQPGDADRSVLISAIRYESSEMPPEQPLPPQVVQDFVKWINAGAVDPRTTRRETATHPNAPAEIDLDQGRQFWAFQPISDFREQLPDSQRSAIGPNVIDHQISDALNQAALAANPMAAAETRLRRLAYDLTGLPPDDAIRKRWMDQPDRSTWNQIVDQLLESRGFAQHWARHWMDVARYADSNGSDFNATFHDAWRYRDYLIDSIDQGRSLDEMIRQQVAGDLLPADSDRQRHDNVVATTFLMLGPKMLSERDKPKLILDVVDEQIDTIGRAFLGMTLGCARCHDHKFDPIPTSDYYALAGIFKSTQTLNGESQKYVSTWNRTELPTTAEHRQAIKDHQSKSSELEKQIKQAKSNLETVKRSGPQGVVVDDVDAKKTGPWVQSTYTPGFIGSGYVHDNNSGDGKSSIEFRTRLPASGLYDLRLAYSHNANRARAVPVTIETADGVQTQQLDQRKKPDAVPWKTLGRFAFSDQQDAVVTLQNKGSEGYLIADAVQFLAVADQDPANQTKADEQAEKAAKLIAAAQSELDQLNKQLEQHKRDAPPPIPQAMSPRDLPSDQITDSPVHIRGEVKNLGDTVRRGFLQVCSSGDAAIASPVGSGRLQLAAWLTDPDNPLVARVMVNRVWMHLMGEGIVRTVDNFGQRGDRPSHPQLLDALAIDFMRDGWQLKPLVRRIVCSQAYSRSSTHQPHAAMTDPENRLLWRTHRKRLSAESIRDTMLLAAGELTSQEPIDPVGDKGVLVTKNVASTQAVAAGIDQPVRSVYLPVIRGNVSSLMMALDGADPDLLVGKRPTTNVPTQSLVLINSEDVNRWATATADRIHQSESDWVGQLNAVYRICLSRQPTETEAEMIENYLGRSTEGAAKANPQDLRDLVAAIFAATEFRMLD
ncbi:DUF1553 domain-containing protein [Stieleria tagensis]|uniref:DUF1553 domain-containing protein n=1 Tax=Stieleria tagensis TaxID=2956795 RepID=UPI00209B4E95|nr:DUF1553 domain-containing protein [Stieleria tagensis]